MKRLLFLSVFIAIFSQSICQDLTSMVVENKNIVPATKYDNPAIIEIHVSWLKTNELAEIKIEDIDKYELFGENISKKKYLFDKTYTYKEAIAPGNPAKRTMFRKPAIYNSVVSIENLLKKDIRKNQISKTEAEELLNIVFDVALNSYVGDTSSLEKEISKSQKPEELLTLFTQNVRVVKD